MRSKFPVSKRYVYPVIPPLGDFYSMGTIASELKASYAEDYASVSTRRGIMWGAEIFPTRALYFGDLKFGDIGRIYLFLFSEV